MLDRTSSTRFKRLLLKPLSSPFLPLFGVTKLFEPGGADGYWLFFIVATSLLFVLGDELERRCD